MRTTVICIFILIFFLGTIVSFVGQVRGGSETTTKANPGGGEIITIHRACSNLMSGCKGCPREVIPADEKEPPASKKERPPVKSKPTTTLTSIVVSLKNIAPNPN